MTAWEPGDAVRIVEGEHKGKKGYLVQRLDVHAWVVRVPGMRRRLVYVPSALERVT